MGDYPKSVWRTLTYCPNKKRAVYKFYNTLEAAERNAASGTTPVRYDASPTPDQP